MITFKPAPARSLGADCLLNGAEVCLELNCVFLPVCVRMIDTPERGPVNGPTSTLLSTQWCVSPLNPTPTLCSLHYAGAQGLVVPAVSQRAPSMPRAGSHVWVCPLSQVPPHHLLLVWCDPLPGAQLQCCQPSCVVGIAEPRFTTACGRQEWL